MNAIDLNFNLSNWHELDRFALLCDQDYNFGNHGRWFNAFRGGLYGVESRIRAVTRIYKKIHAWHPIEPRVYRVEADLANLFFNMDSCIECIVFALNALGYCAAPTTFRDVTSRTALSRINPRNIIGENKKNPGKTPVVGYSDIFPSVAAYWRSRKEFLQVIFDQHDVSKHRRTIFVGGQTAMNPPSGYFEHIGMKQGDVLSMTYHPMETILLDPDPKAPDDIKNQPEHLQLVRPTLEKILPSFELFVDSTGSYAVADAKANIQPPVSEFRTK